MKKFFSVLLSILLLLGCTVPAMAEQTAGGWTVCEDTTLTPEAQAAFDKAMEGFAGVGYTPVALLATQVVAGVNYCLLVKGTTVTATPVSFYALMYIYAGVDGTAEVLNVRDLNVTGEANLAGGWMLQDETTQEAADAFAKAMQDFVGVGYNPIALLSTQVVAGVNYRFLCVGTPVVLNPVPFYAIVTVYADLDGAAMIMDVQTVNISVYDPAAALEGVYDDITSERAFMDITAEGDMVKVIILWSDSAEQTTLWEFIGAPDGDTITYDDCVKTVITADEKGNENYEFIYTDGVGTLTVTEDGNIT